MDGVLYKIDKAKKRLTDNIIAELDGCNEQIWFTSKNMPLLNLDKGDFVHFSANDMPINNDYEVLQVLLNMISCKRL